MTVTDQIRAMRKGAELFCHKANKNSVKAIASRVGGTSQPIRKYVTKTEKDGVRVWRVT